MAFVISIQGRKAFVLLYLPSNMALNLAHFVRWTLRDKAAQRRLALRYAAYIFATREI